MSALIVTLVGPDRPGLVGVVSETVREHGGNWLESRMSHLAGQFAGIVHIDVSPESSGSLTTALQQLDGEGLTVTVVSDTAAEPTSVLQLWDLQVTGNDRPGIVKEVAGVLARHSANVEELTTTCGPAPHGGGAIFTAKARIGIPDSASDELQNALESLANDLMIDLTPSAG